MHLQWLQILLALLPKSSRVCSILLTSSCRALYIDLPDWYVWLGFPAERGVITIWDKHFSADSPGSRHITYGYTHQKYVTESVMKDLWSYLGGELEILRPPGQLKWFVLLNLPFYSWNMMFCPANCRWLEVPLLALFTCTNEVSSLDGGSSAAL